MKVEEAQLALKGERHAEESRDSRETKKVFLNGGWQRFEDVFQGRKRAAGAESVAPPGRAKVACGESGEVKALIQKMLLAIIDAITRGGRVTVDGCKIAAGRRQGVPTTPEGPPEIAVAYERRERVVEQECTRFSACGEVRTADGRTVKFDLDLEMSRRTEVESVEAGVNTYRLKDPLVINFDGKAAELTASRFSFDLEGDGKAEDIPFVGVGSGFLALDRDGNGKVDDGRELFGALSGDGFADLAAYDGNRDGWLDEGDAAFGDLLVWSRGQDGEESLDALKDRGVGALYLGSADTEFSLKDGGDRMLGRVRASGIYLTEAGEAGTLQQVDLAV